jgi:hypothetical protein
MFVEIIIITRHLINVQYRSFCGGESAPGHYRTFWVPQLQNATHGPRTQYNGRQRRRSTGTEVHAIRLMDSCNPTLRAIFVSETIAALFMNLRIQAIMV